MKLLRNWLRNWARVVEPVNAGEFDEPDAQPWEPNPVWAKCVPVVTTERHEAVK